MDSLNQLVVGSIPTRPTNSLKNNKFLDATLSRLKSFPHRSEFPPFAVGKLLGHVRNARNSRASSIRITRVPS
jgi:hypothetical protein